jgi:hypothetical protein
MIELQSIANEIRDRLVEHEAIRRLGIEVLWAAGNPDVLTIRARHRDRVLTVERSAPWHERPAHEQAVQLAHELVGNALDTLRAAPPPPRWRRGLEGPGTEPEQARPQPGPAVVRP